MILPRVPFILLLSLQIVFQLTGANKQRHHRCDIILNFGGKSKTLNFDRRKFKNCNGKTTGRGIKSAQKKLELSFVWRHIQYYCTLNSSTSETHRSQLLKWTFYVYSSILTRFKLTKCGRVQIHYLLGFLEPLLKNNFLFFRQKNNLFFAMNSTK